MMETIFCKRILLAAKINLIQMGKKIPVLYPYRFRFYEYN